MCQITFKINFCAAGDKNMFDNFLKINFFQLSDTFKLKTNKSKLQTQYLFKSFAFLFSDPNSPNVEIKEPNAGCMKQLRIK